MALLIVQLSDLHLSSVSGFAFKTVDELSRVIIANATNDTDIAIVVNGDLVNRGQMQNLYLAEQYLTSILKNVSESLPGAINFVVMVPGNHDCDLEADQALRDLAITTFKEPKLPKSDFLDLALKPQELYLKFASELRLAGAEFFAIDNFHPLFRYVEIMDRSENRYAFHLLNTSWMSTRNEKTGSLTFPIDAIEFQNSEDCSFRIAVQHHPFNWFAQPNSMRQFREKVEMISDLVLTGHEHSSRSVSQSIDGARLQGHLEGGTIEGAEGVGGSFNLVHLAPERNTMQVSRFQWTEGSYFTCESKNEHAIDEFRGRVERRFELAGKFETQLEDSEFPFGHDSKSKLKLSDFFVFPDLRDLDSLNSSSTKRVKADSIAESLKANHLNFLVGAEKCGRTSLLRMLFIHYHRIGLVPLLLTSSDLDTAAGNNAVQDCIRRALKKQYRDLPLEQFEQLSPERKILLIDNWDKCRFESNVKEQLIEGFSRLFRSLIFTVRSGSAPREASPTGGTSNALSQKRFEICDFGKTRLEVLAAKWLGIGVSLKQRSELRANAQKLCKRVERALRTNSIPHHPWILVTLLRQCASSEQSFDKDGSYGHLYNAVITAALHASRYAKVDIATKYTYLAALAHRMYSSGISSLDETLFQQFHADHCTRYDLRIEFSELIGDFNDANILRLEDDGYFFHSRYTFCFFLAWYISRSLRSEDGVNERESIVRQLVANLHHEEYANTVLFLAHLTNDSFVLKEMQDSASKLFSDTTPCCLEADVDFLSELFAAPPRFSLPRESPTENLRKRQEKEDDFAASRGNRDSDGRNLEVHPKDEMNSEYLHQIKASQKTIQILGQVLRNEVGAIEREAKDKIVSQIFLLQRRRLQAILADYKTQMALVNAKVAELIQQQFDSGELDQDTVEKSREMVRRSLLGIALFMIFSEIKSLSESVGLDHLDATFQRHFHSDSCMLNRLFDVAICFDHFGRIPTEKVTKLHRDSRAFVTAQTIACLLVVEHFYFYDVDYKIKQSLCSKLGIDVPPQSMDANLKRIHSKK